MSDLLPKQIVLLNEIAAKHVLVDDIRKAIQLARADIQKYEQRIGEIYRLLAPHVGSIFLDKMSEDASRKVEPKSVLMNIRRVKEATAPADEVIFPDHLARLTEYVDLIQRVAKIRIGLSDLRDLQSKVVSKAQQERESLSREIGGITVNFFLDSAKNRVYPGTVEYEIIDSRMEATVIDLGDLAAFFGPDLSDVNGEVLNTLLQALASSKPDSLEEWLRQYTKNVEPLSSIFLDRTYEKKNPNRSTARYDFSEEKFHRPFDENISPMNDPYRNQEIPNRMNRDKR
jgi:hypothetical protein